MPRDPLMILVVEDDEDFARTLVDGLTDEGDVPHLATSGARAIAIAQGTRIDCVVLDLQLPDTDGFTVARELRNGLLAPTSAIVLLTGSVSASPQEADAAGIDFILTKPITQRLLGSLLRQLQSGRRRKVALTRE